MSLETKHIERMLRWVSMELRFCGRPGGPSTERRMFRSVRVGCGTYKVLQPSPTAATRALA
jgi:hypothetical protein